jgi:DNA polymerase-3 subunit delta
MAKELRPEDVLRSLSKGKLDPVYMFYGLNEFLLERTLTKIRDSYIPEGARDFNQQVCYGGEVNASEIISMARTMPFMSPSRLIIVRRTDEFSTDHLNMFVPYIEDPVETTCLIFVSLKTDFKKRFYKCVRDSGCAVIFNELKEDQVAPWIMTTAREMGLNIDRDASLFLQQMAGKRLQDIYSELTKLSLSYGSRRVGENEVRESAVNSRMYSVFELMDEFSCKNIPGVLSVLARFLEEEDKKSAPMQIIGMLNRQLGLLLRTKDIIGSGSQTKDVASLLGIPPFLARKCLDQSKHWSIDELEKGITTLFNTDRLLKTGARPRPLLENLFINLCG